MLLSLFDKDDLDTLKIDLWTKDMQVMEMDRFWHPRMTWYGPSGIGTGRGIDGFRKWHQIPFLKAMPDRLNESFDIARDGETVIAGKIDAIGVVAIDTKVVIPLHRSAHLRQGLIWPTGMAATDRLPQARPEAGR